MTGVQVVAASLFLGLTAYALLAGADFGGGFWDLTAGNSGHSAALRERIEHSLGPVWEANNVWIVFALVVAWTGFPTAFAAIVSTTYIPLTLVAFGIILRGSAFAFRESVEDVRFQRIFGATFAASSILTPFFLATVAGAIASGRIPLGITRGSVITSWANPTSALGGVLAVGVCAWLAAVYLAGDTARDGQRELTEAFRHRALGAGVVTGAIALGGILVLRSDAHQLYAGLVGRALPVVVLSGVAGLASLGLLWRRHYSWTRVTGALAVAAILWAWAVAQYPRILVGGPTLGAAAAPPAVIHSMVWALGLGALIVVPSLGWLFWLFTRGSPPAGGRQLRAAGREDRT